MIPHIIEFLLLVWMRLSSSRLTQYTKDHGAPFHFLPGNAIYPAEMYFGQENPPPCILLTTPG